MHDIVLIAKDGHQFPLEQCVYMIVADLTRRNEVKDL